MQGIYESFSLSVRLSIWSHRVRAQMSDSKCPIWIIFYTIAVHQPRMCHGNIPSSYLQGQGHSAHSQNPCTGHKSSLPCLVWIIFHTIVVNGPRLCHDLDLRSYLKGLGRSAHVPNSGVSTISPYCHIDTYLQGQCHSAHTKPKSLFRPQ